MWRLGIVFRGFHRLRVGRSIPDNVKLARSTSNTPRHDGGSGWALVDLRWSRPCCSVINGEAVVEVVVVGEHNVNVSCKINADIDELVSVGDRRVRVDVHSMVSECQAAICGYCKPDRVEAAVETRCLCCACDSAKRLVDVVVGCVDCKIPYLVLK